MRAIQVAGGFDVADGEISCRAEHGDRVITAEIALAALALEKHALAFDPRGERYTPEPIAQRLSMRNFMAPLRGADVNRGGPPTLDAPDRQTLANPLDRRPVQRASDPHGVGAATLRP